MIGLQCILDFWDEKQFDEDLKKTVADCFVKTGSFFRSEPPGVELSLDSFQKFEGFSNTRTGKFGIPISPTFALPKLECPAQEGKIMQDVFMSDLSEYLEDLDEDEDDDNDEAYLWKNIESEEEEDPIILKAKTFTARSFRDKSFKSVCAKNAFGTVHDVVKSGNHICFKYYNHRWRDYADKPTPEPSSDIWEYTTVVEFPEFGDEEESEFEWLPADCCSNCYGVASKKCKTCSRV
jgi:hypothetical protein